MVRVESYVLLVEKHNKRSEQCKAGFWFVSILICFNAVVRCLCYHRCMGRNGLIKNTDKHLDRICSLSSFFFFFYKYFWHSWGPSKCKIPIKICGQHHIWNKLTVNKEVQVLIFEGSSFNMFFNLWLNTRCRTYMWEDHLTIPLTCDPDLNKTNAWIIM